MCMVHAYMNSYFRNSYDLEGLRILVQFVNLVVLQNHSRLLMLSFAFNDSFCLADYLECRMFVQSQYYFDTLFPRIPVPVMRQIVSNLERLKMSTQSSGVTGTGSRHATEDTARRPPSVKAALSVSFGQRAPHRASTRDSSPVRRNVPIAREFQAHGDDHRLSQHESKRHIKDDEEDRNKSRERERFRSNARLRDRIGDRERERAPEVNRARERDWEESRDRNKQSDRSRDRDCDHTRVRQRHREWESSRSRKRERTCDDSGHLSYGSGNRCTARSPERSHSGDKETGSNKLEDGAARKHSLGKFQGGVHHNLPDRGRASVLTSFARLQDVYGTGSERGHEEQRRPADVKERNCEDVIHLGGPTWR